MQMWRSVVVNEDRHRAAVATNRGPLTMSEAQACSGHRTSRRQNIFWSGWPIAMIIALTSCASAPPQSITEEAVFERRDDLLTAGLGLDGLRQSVVPTATDAASRRRQATWSNWRAIADVSEGGGLDNAYGRVAPIPGIEIKSWLGEVGLFHPHGVMLQIPDRFDVTRPCLVVAPVSGSRGIYGALATAGAWALTRGCAVVYTDKGAGTGFYEFAAREGIGLDGAPVTAGDIGGFIPDARGEGVAIKHAHSKDHPEAHWGRMTLSATRFALSLLERQFPGKRFTAGNTRIIAASISNGAGAVLRALEQDTDGLIDGVVAAAPQVSLAGMPSLLEYAQRAALLAPCAQLHPDLAGAPIAPFLLGRTAEFQARCAALAERGLIAGSAPGDQANDALRQLMALGFSKSALDNNPTNLAADLWRALAVTYTQSYARAGIAERLCGYQFAPTENGRPRASTAAERGQWFGTSSGIAPTAGIQIVAPQGPGPDPALEGLLCLHQALIGDSQVADRVRTGIVQVRATARLPNVPVVVLHGRDDGLLPVEIAREYARRAWRNGARRLTYWEIENVQHFDGFLGQPAYAQRFLPLLPYFYQALDQLSGHLDGGPAPAPSQVIRSKRRAGTASGVEALSAEHLGFARSEPGVDAIQLDQEAIPD